MRREEQYFIKSFPFSMHFNSKNEQSYPNLDVITFHLDNIFYITVMRSTAIIIMQFTETLFSIILYAKLQCYRQRSSGVVR